MDKIRVFIIDEHPVIRRGLRALFASCHDIDVVGEAGDGAAAVAAAAELAPDVVLLDMRLPGPAGAEPARRLRRAAPKAKAIVFSAYADEESVREALRAGARAYLLKSCPEETLIDAVRAVQQGHWLLSPELLDAVLSSFERIAQAYARETWGLSPEDLRVLELAAGGASNREIGQAMFWSERTVKRRLEEIVARLQARNRTQAVAEAIRRGLI